MILGGIYTLPSYLSQGAKDLISSMLVVDPLKRIIIPEIRLMPWFSKNLPDYLSLLPSKSESIFDKINETIVDEIEKKTDFCKSTILRALKEKDNNQIKVAYQLVLDNKKLINKTNFPSAQVLGFLGASPPISWDNSSIPVILFANERHLEGRLGLESKKKRRNPQFKFCKLVFHQFQIL